MKTHTQREKGKLRSLCLRHTWIHLAESKSRAVERSGWVKTAVERRQMRGWGGPSSTSPCSSLTLHLLQGPFVKALTFLMLNTTNNSPPTRPTIQHHRLQINSSMFHHIAGTNAVSLHILKLEQKIRWALLFCRIKEFHLDNSFIYKPWGPFSGYKRNSFLTRTILA